ncbi:SMI1 / KNR4 family (SUKH-1) [Amycolatopsis pretoriensis]|uniref:SMI1 / KNR4 family (SUKH-1) n=1 Tax=Amycolatopsis pretoriensis TaxID=218821 RepID=A0A1H5R923_9PSEU|nr:SMI1/KNR4 family protein [Amycolatopsis pretoriensis]SEF34028.1 SMI1 / KNR4 family (SUKH-1) [Amycolatopsis pretoriensis]
MDWEPWLRKWSAEWISTAEPGELDPAVTREEWLGFAPASEDDVAAAEARLGVRLPPSYRQFLRCTNGWRDAGGFVWRLRDTTTVGWLRDLEPFWEEPWEDFVGADDGTCFSRGLLVSLEADAGILFLDPGDVDESGEWAAYSLFSWRAEPPARFASFTALMEDLYAEFHQMRKPAGETRDGWDAEVERARVAALAGDVGLAAGVLARAEDFGRERATLLRVQILLLSREWYEAGMLLGRLLHPSFLPAGFLTDPLFTEELLPYLFDDHLRGARQGRMSVLQGAMIGERPEIMSLISENEPRFSRPGEGFTYGNPEFDEPVRRARAAHQDDPDALWAAILAALPLWRPRTPDHIAPVALLADPVLAAAITPARGRELLTTPRHP